MSYSHLWTLRILYMLHLCWQSITPSYAICAPYSLLHTIYLKYNILHSLLLNILHTIYFELQHTPFSLIEYIPYSLLHAIYFEIQHTPFSLIEYTPYTLSMIYTDREICK